MHVVRESARSYWPFLSTCGLLAMAANLEMPLGIRAKSVRISLRPTSLRRYPDIALCANVIPLG